MNWGLTLWAKLAKPGAAPPHRPTSQQRRPPNRPPPRTHRQVLSPVRPSATIVGDPSPDPHSRRGGPVPVVRAALSAGCTVAALGGPVGEALLPRHLLASQPHPLFNKSPQPLQAHAGASTFLVPVGLCVFVVHQLLDALLL